MTDNDEPRFDLSRRTVLQGTTGLGTLGLLSGLGAASGNPGGDPPSRPPSGGGAGDGDPIATVTLITGQTIHVTADGDRRHYTLADEDAGSFRLYELEAGTYVVPDGADLERFSPELFNVDFLIEQGLTDEETKTIPVIVEFDAEVDGGADASSLAAGGFTPTATLESIDSVAGEVAKERTAATTRNVLSAGPVGRVHLDVRHEALLDTSTGVIDAPTARDQFDVDGSGVSIAVLDTGIDADHPDFGDRVVSQTDFSGDGVQDNYGHGTHVAGIAAGGGTESGGTYVGVAPGADLLNVKVLGDDGSGLASEIVSGIEHAVEQGADVINMSLGGPATDDGPMVQAVDAAVDQGVVAAIAAGNTSGYRAIGSPGQAANALTVGASSGDSELAWFSSGGPTPYDYLVKPEIVAPGTDVTSTGSEDAGDFPYTEYSGTSMATPHVAGLAALLLEHDSGRTPDDVRDALVATADPLENEDVFTQGGGIVDATAAIGSDLRVRDAVTNFGLYETATDDAATVTLENAGTEPIEVDVGVELENVQSGDSLPDNASASPSTLTVAPGATESVDVTIDTTDAFGFNSGVLTFDTGGGESHRAIFGFVRGVEVTVEKIPHENSDGVEGDGFIAHAHDGSFSHSALSAFDANGEYTFVLLSDGGQFTCWSSGELRAAEGELAGEPTWTVADVEIDPDNTHVTLDESATVPRVLDTSRIAEREPLEMRRFDANLYANFAEGPAVSASKGYTGDFGLRNAHVTPLEETEPTNVGTAYLFFSADSDAEYTLDTSTVYHLFYGSLSLAGPTDVVEVDPDDLAEERFAYHRTYDGQLLGVSPAMYPADLENFPTYFTISFLTDVSDERVVQTWYRNEQARYTESWYDDASFSGIYQLVRAVDLAPEAGETYHQPFNRDPLVDRLTTWNLDDGALTLRGQWATDQAEEPFVPFQYARDSQNEWAVSVDDEVVAEDTNYYWNFPVTEIPDVSPGSVVDVSLRGNVLNVTPRETTTVTDYEVTYEPGAANEPPQIDTVYATGLDALNEVPSGPILAFVDVTHRAAGVDDFQAFYAPSGTVTETPFEDPGGWREAPILFGVGGFFGALVNATGYSGNLDLATTAVDTDGNRVEATTFDALTVRDGGQFAVPVAIKPNAVNVDSNGVVPVSISAEDDVGALAEDDVDVDERDVADVDEITVEDVGEIAVDTLRFGSPAAVAAGGGAAPVRSKRLDEDTLQVHFAASETGYSCTDGPVAGLLTGELRDGTVISGVDVIRKVICSRT